MQKAFVNEAKKYCSDIEKLFMMVLSILSICVTLSLIVFILTGMGVSVFFIAIIMLVVFIIKRRIYISLLITVNNDVKTNNTSEILGKAVQCKKDVNYSRLSWNNDFNLNAGNRFILTLEDGTEYRMTKRFNLKRFIDPMVRITYLTNSKVVVKFEVVDMDDLLEDYADEEITDIDKFISNRMMINITENKIRFPVITAVSKDDVMNKLYVNVYYEKNTEEDKISDSETELTEYETMDDEKKERLLAKKTVEIVKSYISKTNSKKANDTEDIIDKVKDLIADVVAEMYKEYKITYIKLYIKRN